MGGSRKKDPDATTYFLVIRTDLGFVPLINGVWDCTVGLLGGPSHENILDSQNFKKQLKPSVALLSNVRGTTGIGRLRCRHFMSNGLWGRLGDTFVTQAVAE